MTSLSRLGGAALLAALWLGLPLPEVPLVTPSAAHAAAPPQYHRHPVRRHLRHDRHRAERQLHRAHRVAHYEHHRIHRDTRGLLHRR